MLNYRTKSPIIRKYLYEYVPMIETKRNLYKSTDTFRCIHDAHKPFKAAMSPYYILQQKDCYPHGCVCFVWKCRLLAKQKKCFRGFEHVGRKCFNCRYFDEEKQHQYPEFILNGQTADQFLDDFTEFEDWVHNLQKRRVLVEGTVCGVIPELSLHWKKRGVVQLRAHGFLIRFERGYIDNISFDDPFYLSLSPLTQNKMQLRNDDELEFEAQLQLNQGRFKFRSASRFYFMQRGSGKALRKSDVLAALNSYTIQEDQPGKCLRCAHGVLTQTGDRTPEAGDGRQGTGPSRRLICLQGVHDYRDCILHLPVMGNAEDSCANPGWDGRNNCHHVL